MEKIEIRDTRNGEWHWVNNAVIACPHITHADKSVYSALTTFSGCKEIHPNFKSIAKRSNVSERAVKNSVKRLLEVGYLKIDNFGKKGLANVYYLLKASQGCEKCKFCTTDKKGKNLQEEGQIGAKRSANFAPQLDNEVDKEIESNDKSLVATPQYGNPQINECLDFLKGQLKGELDGASKYNRNFCHNLLNRFKKEFPLRDPVFLVKWLINFGLTDDFHGPNITNFRYLYYNSRNIINKAKKKFDEQTQNQSDAELFKNIKTTK